MHRHSPILPIVFGTSLVIVIIGVAIVATFNRNPQTAVVLSPTSTISTTTKAYTFQNVTLYYPDNWMLTEDTYTNAAGNGGIVGATLTSPNLHAPEDKIVIGGPQADCVAFVNTATKCVTVGTLPVYTASGNADILSVFDQLKKTAVVTNPEWITYSDTIHHYSMQYLTAMTVKENQEYPPVPGEGIKTTVFMFPEELYSGGTTQEASVNVARTNTECATWPDGVTKIAASATKTINGIPFEYRINTDAATSNYYSTYEYSTMKDGKCFRVSLFIHSTSPGAHYSDEATIEEKNQKNKEIENTLKTRFEQMVSSFTFSS